MGQSSSRKIIQAVVQLTVLGYCHDFNPNWSTTWSGQLEGGDSMQLFTAARPPHVTRHDSPLYELALETLAEHRPEDVDANPVRLCDACRQSWPCARYQLALAAEIQLRSYESHRFAHLRSPEGWIGQ